MIRESLGDIDGAVRALRASIEGLSVSSGDVHQFASELRSIVETARATVAHVDLDLQDSGRGVPLHLRGQVVAVAREAVSNVLRHAQADRLEVALAVTDGQVVLRVCDDGVGIADPVAAATSGMTNLRHRAEAYGGSARWRPSRTAASRPGTTVLWTAAVDVRFGDAAQAPGTPSPTT